MMKQNLKRLRSKKKNKKKNKSLSTQIRWTLEARNFRSLEPTLNKRSSL